MNRILMLIFFTVVIFIEGPFNKYLLSIRGVLALFCVRAGNPQQIRQAAPASLKFILLREKEKLNGQK